MPENKEYESRLVESSRQLTARDKIRYQNFSAAIAIDSLVADDTEVASIFTPIGYASFAVHNEKAENTDYDLYIIEGKGGTLYKTGSNSFFSRFKLIFDTMAAEAPGEEYTISVMKRPSNHYKGKYLLICQLD